MKALAELLDRAHLLLARPAGAFRLEEERPLVWWPALAFVWAACAEAASRGATGASTLAPFGRVLLEVASEIAMWSLFGALVHLTAGILGGTGSARHMAASLAMCPFPKVLLPAFALAGGPAFGAASAAAWVWQLWLAFVAVREVHRLSNDKALLAILLVPAAALALVVLAAVGLAAGLVGG